MSLGVVTCVTLVFSFAISSMTREAGQDCSKSHLNHLWCSNSLPRWTPEMGFIMFHPKLKGDASCDVSRLSTCQAKILGMVKACKSYGRECAAFISKCISLVVYALMFWVSLVRIRIQTVTEWPKNTAREQGTTITHIHTQQFEILRPDLSPALQGTCKPSKPSTWKNMCIFTHTRTHTHIDKLYIYIYLFNLCTPIIRAAVSNHIIPYHVISHHIGSKHFRKG